jgi:outer membrane receptor protein involved in Fe transport
MRSTSALFVNASALAIGVVGVTPAFGQVSGPPEVVVPAAAQEDEVDEEPGSQDEPVARNSDGSEARGTITVTGTRIRLPNLESLEPTVTLDRRQIQERNFTNVADALNELPGFRGSVTPALQQASFGQGVNFVNNFGLGSNRTLTLVNNRRFVSSNVATNFGNASAGTQVDLNVIPAILTDRIDTVGIGGAPVYGSDAIAGTVNVILRTRYTGVELQGTSGITEQGDNFRWNISGLAGWDFGGRANLTVAVSHDEVDGLLFNDRDFLRDGLGNATNPTSAEAAILRPGNTNPATDGRLNPLIGFNNNTSDLAPGAVVVRGAGIPLLVQNGLIIGTNLSGPFNTGTTFNNTTGCQNPRDPSLCLGANGSIIPPRGALTFDPSGNLVPFNAGTLFRGTTSSGGEGFQFQNFQQITSDLNRSIFNAFFTFDVTDDIELFLEGVHFRSRADELVDQPSFQSNLFSGVSAPLEFSATDPRLSAQARAEFAARGVTRFRFAQVQTDLLDQSGFNTTRIFRGVVGLRGDFQAFGRSMNFEAYANHGITNNRDVRGAINQQNFVNAINNCQVNPAVNATALAGARGIPVADPNCVPLNLFGSNSITPQARAYVTDDVDARNRNEQTVYNVNVGGSLFDIWGGAVGFNVGYEHRKEFARFTPDQFQQQGLGRSVAIVPLEGSFNLDEVFGELLLPLVSPETGLSFIQSAQIFARGRYVHSSINGGFFSWALGGTFAPIEDIEFRGNFTRSFRAPAVTELFLPTVSAFSTVADLCSVANRNAGPVPAIRFANCTAFLARFPNATPDPAGTATVPILTGGNQNLENEQADSYTVGVLLRPRFLPRFSLTADYISITLNQPIASLTVGDVVSGCFDNAVFNTNDPANGNAFCSRILRDPTTGRVVNDPATPAVQVGFVNGQEIQFRGIQGTMNYALPIDRWGMNGTFTVGGDLLYVRKRLNNITGVAPARSDGTIGDPEFSGQIRLRYVEDTWGTNTTINYIGEQVFSRFNRQAGAPGQGADIRELDELDDYVLVNSSIFFDPTDDFRLTIAVTNVFNRFGQEYFGFVLPSGRSDLLGRRFSVSGRVRF